MNMYISLSLFALLLTGGCGQSTDTTPTETAETTTPTTPVATTLPTTPAATTPPTTPAATTTSVDTTTKTEAPVTTQTSTLAPKTTPKPSPSPTTVTSAPSTTPGPVTTTPAPKPPVAELASWNVTEGNVTCIRADLQIRFMIPFNGRDDYIALSQNATTEGSTCSASNVTQELRLTDRTAGYVFLLTFEKDDKNAYLKNISLSYDLPGDSGITYNDTSMFKVKVGNSYMCNNPESVPLFNVTMEVFKIHLQAFGSTAGGDFGTAEECEADDKVDDIVPIAVGCALLALVVVVLIAYFVGRRRSRQKGYQSV